MTEIIDAEFAARLPVSGMMTVRNGGHSSGAYGSYDGGAGLNLGAYCGDQPDAVLRNRALLQSHVGKPITWMRQVHGTVVHRVTAQSESDSESHPLIADALITTLPGKALGVLSADCLPVLFASEDVIGVAHAGWRGLSAGVLSETVRAMTSVGAEVSQIHVWLGAAIGPTAFEVGADVREAFAPMPDSARYFSPLQPKPGKLLCDLYGLARAQLNALNVGSVSGGDLCTVTDPVRFFSYRRDGLCGRMAGVIRFD